MTRVLAMKRTGAAAVLVVAALSMGTVSEPGSVSIPSRVVALPAADAKPQPACLSAEEQQAIEDSAAGRKLTPEAKKALKSARKKLDQAEKYAGERNKQKRSSC